MLAILIKNIITFSKLVAALLTAVALVGTVAWAAPGRNRLESCTIKVPQPRPVDLTTLVEISVDQVMKIVRAAYPKAKVRTVSLEDLNSCLVYAVNLVSGPTILIDAGSGAILVNNENESQEE
ncbi:MAG: PepSY domain-containing protein [Desulfomonilaceae bacterium]